MTIMSVISNAEASGTLNHLLNQNALTQSKPKLGPRRPLHVERLLFEEYLSSQQMARNWVLIAEKKIRQISPLEEPEAIKQFKDNQNISAFFWNALVNASSSPLRKKDPLPIYTCKDEGGAIHGLAMATESEDGAQGHLMVTAPKNIRCKVNETEPDRVEGVGSTFLQFAAEEIRKRNKTNLILTPSASSERFYKKMEFDFTEGKRNISKNFAEPRIPSNL